MIKINSNIPGFFIPAAMKVIGWLSSQVPENGNIVQIGVLWGRLTNVIIENKSLNTKVICIDSLLYVDRILKTFNFTEKNWNSKNWGSFGDKKIVIDYLQKNHNNISLSSIIELYSSTKDVIIEQKKSEFVNIDLLNSLKSRGATPVAAL